MRSRTIAIAGSIAAMSFAAVPVAAVAATTHHSSSSSARVDRPRGLTEVRHTDRTPDRTGTADRHTPERSRDLRDR
jgi:hypothetical protein